MAKEKLQEELRAKLELMDGEEIVWSGRPEPYPLLSAEAKNSIILRWVISGVLLIGLTVAYAIACARIAAAEFSPVMEGIIVVILGWIGTAPIFDRKKMLKRFHYYVTNKRVLIHVEGKDNWSLNRQGVKFRFVESEKGCISVLFGAAVTAKSAAFRGKAIMAEQGESNDGYIGMVFYNIKDSEALRELFLGCEECAA